VLGKFQPGLAIDCWTLVPDIWKRRRGRETSGQFIIRDRTVEIAPGRRRSLSTGIYFAEFNSPSDNQAPATGIVFLVDHEGELPRVILLVGDPDGFGKYQWSAICPTTLKPAQMLHFDTDTQLFVSRKAMGKPAPLSVQRLSDIKIVLGKYFQKFGSDSSADGGNLRPDGNFSPFKTLFEIVEDALFAASGLPSAIKTDSGAIDVLATIQNVKARQRLPEHLLARNSRPAPKVPVTKEELIAKLKLRGLPIDLI
jgi:hypothetical protein